MSKCEIVYMNTSVSRQDTDRAVAKLAGDVEHRALLFIKCKLIGASVQQSFNLQTHVPDDKHTNNYSN